MGLLGGELGEVRVLQAGQPGDDAFALEAGEAFLEVGGVLGPVLLFAVDQVQAGPLLEGEDAGDGLPDRGGKLPGEAAGGIANARSRWSAPRCGELAGSPA